MNQDQSNLWYVRRGAIAGVLTGILLALIVLVLAHAAFGQDGEFCCFWSPKGRVTDKYNRAVRTPVTLWGCKSPKCTDWVSWTAYSNTFGYFSFDMIPAQDYAIVVVSRQGNYSAIVGPLTTGNFIEAVVR